MGSLNSASGILMIDAERYHSFISTCKAGMQKVADSKRDVYIRVGQTNFYYRGDVENHYSEISKILTEIIPENINAEEKELLDSLGHKGKSCLGTWFTPRNQDQRTIIAIFSKST